MTAETWRMRYRLALARARERVATAGARGELIACGLTNNVDLVVTVTGEMLAHLLCGRAPRLEGARQTSAATPGELLTAIVQHIAVGEGIDIPVANPETQAWLVSRVVGRSQLGGSGAQTANTLAALGFSALVHLTGRSPAQVAAFTWPERIHVPTGSGLLPVNRTACVDHPTMWHVALEYPEGVSFVVAGRRYIAPAGSRVIVSHDPVNSAVQLDQTYVTSLVERIMRTPAVLLSGYSQIVDPDRLAMLMDDTLVAVRRWRERRPGIAIHLELGAMPERRVLAGVAKSMAAGVSSIGMNVDELRDLTTVWKLPAADHPAMLRESLAALHTHLPIARLNVHTGVYAASIVTGDPGNERDALLFAALVASTRARVGHVPTFADLDETLAVANPHPVGVDMLARLGLVDGIAPLGEGAFVMAPTIEVPTPAAMVGLGDSFTAGVLAML